MLPLPASPQSNKGLLAVVFDKLSRVAKYPWLNISSVFRSRPILYCFSGNSSLANHASKVHYLSGRNGFPQFEFQPYLCQIWEHNSQPLWMLDKNQEHLPPEAFKSVSQRALNWYNPWKVAKAVFSLTSSKAQGLKDYSVKSHFNISSISLPHSFRR